MNKSLNDVDFTKRNGLLPVVVQDKNTKDILTLAYAKGRHLKIPLGQEMLGSGVRHAINYG